MPNIVMIMIFIIITVSVGYFFKLLTLSGALCAFFIGLLVSSGIGFEGLYLLGIFFGTSSFWSKWKPKKKVIIEGRLEKGSRRDWEQVLANGGIAAIISIIFTIYQDEIWLMAFAIAIASANSDTWASEIGSMSRTQPISIRTFRRTESGSSGAISLLGTISSIGGSLIIALAAYFLLSLSPKQVLIIFLFGFIGNLIDTLLGAFIQAEYQCTVCGTILEKKNHCHQKTVLIRGIPFMNNDLVNLLSVLLATILGKLYI